VPAEIGFCMFALELPDRFSLLAVEPGTCCWVEVTRARIREGSNCRGLS